MAPLTLGILAGLGLLGTSAILLGDSTSPEGATDHTARFVGRLKKGQLYRLWGRVDPTYSKRFTEQSVLSEDLRTYVERAGFSPVMLATQDPSDAKVWTFIAKWNLSSSETFDQGPITFYQIQEVDDPPATMTRPVDPPLQLDIGLLVDEIDAIRYALSRDSDPGHLTGFSATLSPEFPVAASLLRAKATLIDADGRGQVLVGALYTQRQRVQESYVNALHRVGFLDDVVDWLKDRGDDVIKALKDATRDLGKVVSDMWDQYGGIIEVLGGWVPGPQLWAIETAYKLVRDIGEGKPVFDVIPNVLSEQGVRFAKGMQAASPYVAMIPGLGQGVAMAMNAASALALAQPLDEAVLDTLVMLIPGGAAAQTGFRTAASMGNAILRGEDVGMAALEGARAGIAQQLGEEAAIAFDAGLALARGKSLQEAGFGALYQLTKGNDLATRAIKFGEAVVKAAQTGKPVETILLQEIASDLKEIGLAYGMAKAKELATQIVQDGSLLQMFPADLATKFQVPESVALAAQSMVREVADGIRIVDAKAIRTLDPIGALLASDKSPLLVKNADPNMARIKTELQSAAERQMLLSNTSPTALKMVESTLRPEQSLVEDPAIVAKRLKDVADAAARGEQAAILAQAALDKAQRELARRKWVDWYRRQIELDSTYTQAAA